MDYFMAFLSVVNTLIIGAFCTTYFKTKGKNRADIEDSEELSLLKERGKNLATKEDIEEITKKQEDVKAEIRKATDKHLKAFELYTAKKHEYYPELYKHIELCVGKVTGLRGARQATDFNNFNKEDITRFITDKSFNELDKELILSYWDNAKPLAIHNIQFTLQRFEYQEAKESYDTAYNFYLLHRLFFSEKVSLTANRLLISLYALWYNYNSDFMYATNVALSEHLLTVDEELNDEIDVLRKELFEKLQEELDVKDTHQ
ncbi:hypothetical protein [Bacillus mycoides]|uniref:hypothetical protein n=1 Tax=Bacillus mycoides TaxID=1405 RepID=UPI0011EC5FC7|nr:hypothetical protein [Bacillus mycoides]QEL88498.1 hypothetical protein DN409_29995 [Bacillus mycoides]